MLRKELRSAADRWAARVCTQLLGDYDRASYLDMVVVRGGHSLLDGHGFLLLLATRPSIEQQMLQDERLQHGLQTARRVPR